MCIRRSLKGGSPEEFEAELIQRGISYTRRDVDNDHVEFEITMKGEGVDEHEHKLQ